VPLPATAVLQRALRRVQGDYVKVVFSLLTPDEDGMPIGMHGVAL